MKNAIYNDSERLFYTQRADYKEAESKCLIKQMIPVDKRTGKMVDVILTINDVILQHNTFVAKKVVDGKIRFVKESKNQNTVYFKEVFYYDVKNGNEIIKERWSLPLALNPTNRAFLEQNGRVIDLKRLIGNKIKIHYDETVSIGDTVIGGIRIIEFLPSDKQKITQEQLLELETLCKKANIMEEKVCQGYGINTLKLNDLPLEKFEIVQNALNKKIAEKKEQTNNQ